MVNYQEKEILALNERRVNELVNYIVDDRFFNLADLETDIDTLHELLNGYMRWEKHALQDLGDGDNFKHIESISYNATRLMNDLVKIYIMASKARKH